MLYKFEKLDEKLDEWTFPKVDSTGAFQLIRTNFREAYDAGDIEFRPDGIYLIYEGKEWKGYMYMQSYRVNFYGKNPKFHLVKCSVIDDFIQKGKFDKYYIWSNNKVNDITDRDNHKVYKDQNLQLCSNCRELIFDNINYTNDFFNTLDIPENQEVLEVDIFGYTRDWQKISKAYRKEQSYQCEDCRIQITEPSDRRFLHVHHKNGDKTDNQKSNLECLCVLCHSKKDATHEHNFGRNRMSMEVNRFVKKYRDDPENLENPIRIKRNIQKNN